MTVMAFPRDSGGAAGHPIIVKGPDRELKHCSSGIGIFPPEEPLVRGAGKRCLEGRGPTDTVLTEENQRKQSGRAIFSFKTFKGFMTSEVMKALIDAEEARHRSFTPKGTLHLTRTLPAQEKEKHKFGICIIFSFASFPKRKRAERSTPDRHVE